MTLGCGAVAGNITSDNVGPQHLINIKRLAYVVRKPEEAFEMPLDYNAAPSGPAVPAGVGPIDRNTVIAAVERYLASRGIAVSASASAAGGPSCSCESKPVPVAKAVVANAAAEVVDRFLARRGGPGRVQLTGRRRCPVSPAPTPPMDPPAKPVDFVCEADVRTAMRENRKIYIGPKTIVTPSARDLAGPSDILVLTQG